VTGTSVRSFKLEDNQGMRTERPRLWFIQTTVRYGVPRVVPIAWTRLVHLLRTVQPGIGASSFIEIRGRRVKVIETAVRKTSILAFIKRNSKRSNLDWARQYRYWESRLWVYLEPAVGRGQGEA